MLKNIYICLTCALLSTAASAKDVITCKVKGQLLTDNTSTVYTAKIKLVNKKYIFAATDSKKVSTPCDLKKVKIELVVDKKNPKIFQFQAKLTVEGDKVDLPILWSNMDGNKQQMNLAYEACYDKPGRSEMREVNNIFETMKCSAFDPSAFPHKKQNIE